MKTALLTLVLSVPSPALAQDSKPTAGELTEQGWQLMPVYSGEHRYFLVESEARETQAAVHMFEAATTLEPENFLALWRLGFAHNLLRENASNRGARERANEHYVAAVEALSRAMDLHPSDHWSPYTRANAHMGAGAFDSAIADFDLSISRVEELIQAQQATGDDQDQRYRSLGRRAECLVRAHRFDEAFSALDAYNREFTPEEWSEWSTNDDLAECCARERDFEGTRRHYDLLIQHFPQQPGGFERRGNLEGLLGDRAAAVKDLDQSIRLELQAGLYSRIWLWILADGETRVAAEEDLRDLLDAPPPHLGPWDLRLGRFLLGAENVPEFITAGDAEIERRMAAGEALADLKCEVLFYAGFYFERLAETMSDPEAAEFGLRQAFEYYRAALRERPDIWKWEWAFARRHLAEVARRLDEREAPPFSIEGERFRDSRLEGELEAWSWCAAGAVRGVRDLGRDPVIGDLFLATVRTDAGARVPILRVVGVD